MDARPIRCLGVGFHGVFPNDAPCSITKSEPRRQPMATAGATPLPSRLYLDPQAVNPASASTSCYAQRSLVLCRHGRHACEPNLAGMHAREGSVKAASPHRVWLNAPQAPTDARAGRDALACSKASSKAESFSLDKKKGLRHEYPNYLPGIRGRANQTFDGGEGCVLCV